MDGDADIASIASLMGEPARAAVLMALIGGRALAATTLAAEAGVAPSTISGHLSRLVDGGLISIERSGRYRYFRLAGAEVAEAVESLARIAPPRQIRSLRQATHAKSIRRARTCYDHLAGHLSVAICEALVRKGVVVAAPGSIGVADPIVGAGRASQYFITDDGRKWLAGFGVERDRSSRRPAVLYCLDWSEQLPHLGGWLGAALLDRFISLGWLRKSERRVVEITSKGRAGLIDEFSLEVCAFD